MAERSTQLKIMGALLAGIGLFVTTTPSAPAPDTLQASAARASRVADSPKAAADGPGAPRRAPTRDRARSAAGTDALDGGSGPDESDVGPHRRPRPARPQDREAGDRHGLVGAARDEHDDASAGHHLDHVRAERARRCSTAATSRGSRTRRRRTSRTSPTRGASTARRDRPTTTASRARCCPSTRPGRRRRRRGRARPTRPSPRDCPRPRPSRSCSRRPTTSSASRHRRRRTTGRTSRSSRRRRRSCRAWSSSSRAGTASSRVTR